MLDIHIMNISSVNLNLLVALDALLRERSVTRAARRVGVTQPAMSNSLAQLRRLFSDPLFRRERHGLSPTPRALLLAPLVAQGLHAFERALVAPSFEPRTSERRFVLWTSDYVELVLMPPLLRELERTAPGVTVEVRPWGLHSVPEALAKGEGDVMIGFFDELPRHHHQSLLFEEDYVCIVRRNHPRVRRTLTLARYLELSHVLVSQQSDSPGSVDRALEKLGKKRRVALRVSHFLIVPVLVGATDLVAAISRRAAEPFATALGLRLLPPPLSLPRSRIRQAWPAELELDPGHRFLRETLTRVASRV
jgi:DNA-binding transcriptional LysR family regulator